MLGLEDLRKSLAARAQLPRILAPVRRDLEETERVLGDYLTSPHAFIQSLARHIERFQGKRLRPAMLHLAARAFGGEAPLAAEAGALVELVHLASLCHDDVLDDALTRRSVPTVNAQWGGKVAVMTGDYVMVRAMEGLARLSDPRVIRVLATAARRICEGELLQIALRFDVRMTEDSYYELIDLKTAALFGAAGELGALLAGASEVEAQRLRFCGRLLGAGFQIVDDCLDLVGIESAAGKSLGCDLRNGEFTLPVLHLLAHTPEEERMEVLRRMRLGGDLSREELRPRLEARGSLEYALKAAQARLAAAREELGLLPPSGARQALLDLLDFVLVRQQ